ncbi:MAG TPA: DNA-directed RNA polymerase subunit omega [Haloplasmataceae bacterium]
MRYPYIDKLLEVVDSKYKLALIASKRAKQIEQGSPIQVEKPQNIKPLGIALEEIVENKLIVK